MRTVGIIPLVLIGAPLFVCAAQQTQAALSVTGGSATDVLGVTSRALSVTPSLTFAPDLRSAFTLQATGTRFDNQRWSVGGGASAAFRAPITTAVAASLNASADATSTSYEFSYRSANVIPALEVSVGRLTVFGGAIAGAASMSATTTSPAQRVPGLFGDRTIPGETSRTTAQRTAASAIAGGTLALLQTRTTSLRVTARTEPNIQQYVAAAQMSIGLGSAASLDLSAGTYSADRLIGTPAGRFLNAGISIRSPLATVRAPRPEGVDTPARGMTRLALSAPDAARVEVAGDFSNWKPMTALRAPNGVWYVDLRIPPGRYRYAFKVNGSAWTVPEGTPTVDDDFGGKSAWLVVSPAQ